MPNISEVAIDRSLTRQRFPLQILLFFISNVLYFIPLALFLYDGYANSGPAMYLGATRELLRDIVVLYVLGISGFTAGSLAQPALKMIHGHRPRNRQGPARFHLRNSHVLFISALCLVFLWTKYSLIGLGAYHKYAFDTQLDMSPVWTFSMFCSESMVLASVLVLFSDLRHNVRWFLLVAGLNAINLLHGTRLFFIITLMVCITYMYNRGMVTLRRVVIIGPIAFLGVLSASYAIMVFRSRMSGGLSLSLAKVLSPWFLESILNQISLVNTLTWPNVWTLTGHPLALLQDIVANTLPRVLVPNKAMLGGAVTPPGLSPLGGMSGYANTLICFGIMFPLFYFAIGFMASWLYDKAKRDGAYTVLYVYFISSTCFRLMRDGDVIPFKMFINALQILALLYLWDFILRWSTASPPELASVAVE